MSVQSGILPPMVAPLVATAAPDPETMWRAMRALLERVFVALDQDAALVDCLDLLVESLGADRGQVLIIDEGGTPRTVYARANGKALDVGTHEQISNSIIRSALEGEKCVTWDVRAMSNVTSSVAVFGIRVAFAAPLHRPSSRARRAVLYVDIRDPAKHVSASHCEFFMASALLIGALLDERARSENARTRLDEALSHTTETRRTPSVDELLGPGSMAKLRGEVDSAIVSKMTVLILGESGTGKTLLAQAIAEASGRRPIVRATLGASDDLNTITSELFGHERGAFSGAAGRRAGLVEYANGGTLVLDELLNLPVNAQRLLLDFTQFGTYRPLGYAGPEPKRADVRIIGATNGDLWAAARDGRFREDLFHRLAGIVLELPPLRERRSDIEGLAYRVLRTVDPSRAWSLSPATVRLLQSPSLEWSGNVRQLERVVLRARERAVRRDAEVTELVPEHFEARDLDGVTPRDPGESSTSPPPALDAASAWQRLQAERARLDEEEQSLIKKTLADTDGVVAYAARTLGVARTTLVSRLDVLGIRRNKSG